MYRPNHTVNKSEYFCITMYKCLETGHQYLFRNALNAGTIRAYRTGRSLSSCDACPAGRYCDAIALVTPTGSCLPGFYCPSGSKVR